jgi:hypothetical protein
MGCFGWMGLGDIGSVTLRWRYGHLAWLEQCPVKKVSSECFAMSIGE